MEYRKQFFLIFIVFLFSFCVACNIVYADYNTEVLWSNHIGGAGDDRGCSMVESGDGGYVIVGDTDSIGAGGYDVYLVKTDANGNEIWSKTYGDLGDDYGYSIVKANDGGYVIAGYTNSFGAGGYDVYLLKTDADGNEIWTKTYGGLGPDVGRSIIKSNDGGYAITGTINGDIYLIKTDADGNEIWTKTYGGGYGRSVIQTDDGGYAVAAQEYFVKTDTDGTLDWKKLRSLPVYPTWKILDAHVYSLVQTSDGGYIGVGYCEYQINSGPDAGTYGGLYVTKIDADGDAEWVIKRPDIVGEVIIKTSDNRYVISCYASIMKIDANGNEIWFMKFGPTYDYRWSVIQTSANEYIMAGKENNDMFIIKTKITPIRIINDRPNPGTVYFESNTSWSDSVRFYIILSDMNKTRGRSNFQLTIIDSNQTVVFSKMFSIRHRINWYVFNLNPKWFKEGEYTANAVAETWNTTKTIQIN